VGVVPLHRGDHPMVADRYHDQNEATAARSVYRFPGKEVGNDAMSEFLCDGRHCFYAL
jgi:hypothetical protein